MSTLCIIGMLVGVLGAFVIYHMTEWLSGRETRSFQDTPHPSTYESPLGFVDRPEDEWLEWAIMDNILDGPDEGLI